MKQLKKPLTTAILSAAVAGTCTVALADQPTSQPQPDVSQEIHALRARIDQLEKQQKEQDAKQQQATQDATVKNVLSDADHRSQFMDSTGVSAGWNASKSQFFIGSEDGNFYFHPGVIAQIRGNVAHREHGHSRGESDTQEGMEVRRAKFYFDGNIFTPDLTYKFQWQDSNPGGAPTLEYAFAQYVFAHKAVGGTGDLAVKAGQFKDIVFKEEFTGDQNQLMVERSLANAFIGGNAPPSNLLSGVDFLLLGKDAPLHAELLIGNGFGSGTTAFGQPHGAVVVFPQTPVDPPTNPAYWGTAVRVDYKVFGDWADTTDFTGMNSGKHDLLDIGGGVDFTDAQGAAAVRYTVDAQYEMTRKLAIFGALYGSNFAFRNVKAPASKTQNNYGAQIEGGYMLDPSLQLVGRYTLVKLDNNFKIAGRATFQEIAAGLNWFGPNGAWGNHAKLSLDLNYLPDGTPGAGGLDYLASGHDNSELVLRTQLNIWF